MDRFLAPHLLKLDSSNRVGPFHRRRHRVFIYEKAFLAGSPSYILRSMTPRLLVLLLRAALIG